MFVVTALAVKMTAEAVTTNYSPKMYVRYGVPPGRRRSQYQFPDLPTYGV